MKIWILNSANVNLIRDQGADETAQDMLCSGMAFSSLDLAMDYVYKVVERDLKELLKDSGNFDSRADEYAAREIIDRGLVWDHSPLGCYEYHDEFSEDVYRVSGLELYCSEYAVSKLFK